MVFGLVVLFGLAHCGPVVHFAAGLASGAERWALGPGFERVAPTSFGKGLADMADGGASGAFLHVPEVADLARCGLVCPSQMQSLF